MGFQQESAEYKDARSMERDVRKRGANGWRVVGQSTYTPRKGILRTLLGGFLFFNRKPVTIVTYQRTEPLS